MAKLQNKVEHLQVKISAENLGGWIKFFEANNIPFEARSKEQFVEMVLRSLSNIYVKNQGFIPTEEELKDIYFRFGWPRSK